MFVRLIIASALLGWLFQHIYACTTIAVGKLASIDGSVMATHTNDGGGTMDPRLVKIPASDYHIGAMRPIYASPENYPRYVGYDRGAEAYFPENCFSNPVDCKEFQPIGYIPQVRHTFAYLEETYGALNEKQVGIVESTCSGVFVASSVAGGGKALLSIDELTKIAMERASTSREAVQIMGELAERYGFYGEEASFEGGAESLYVTDPEEAWSFHILADPTGTSAIWVAARVPDDSISVTANMFSIREVNLADTKNFLGTKNMWKIAAEYGLYVPGNVKDFALAFSDGEYAHKYYSGRRMWDVYRLLAPSGGFSPIYDNLKEDAPYPFSYPVDKRVSQHDLMTVLRDWYAGTNYSTGAPDAVLAGGPFATPDRFKPGPGEYNTTGSWERTIALFRSSDTYVVQSRSCLPDDIGGVLWYGPLSAHATIYIPVLVAVDVVPDSLQYGWQGHYNLTTNFWANRVIQQLMQIKYSYMIEDLRNVQSHYEAKGINLVNNITSKASAAEKEALIHSVKLHVTEVRDAMLSFQHYLLFKYADGFINFWSMDDSGTHPSHDASFTCYSPGYPQWWLEQVGYQNGPPPVNSPVEEILRQRNLANKVKYETYQSALNKRQDVSELQRFTPMTVSTLRQCIETDCNPLPEETMYSKCVVICTQRFES